MEKYVAVYTSTLDTETAGSSETLVTSYQTISQHVTEDVDFHIHAPEKPQISQLPQFIYFNYLIRTVKSTLIFGDVTVFRRFGDSAITMRKVKEVSHSDFQQRNLYAWHSTTAFVSSF